MEANTALLRIVTRATQASAAIVAGPDGVAVAAWGCDGAAADAIVRAARASPPDSSLAWKLPVRLRDGTAGVLLLVSPARDADFASIAPLVTEIGALCDAGGVPETFDALTLVMVSVERLPDAIAIVETAGDAHGEERLAYVNAEFGKLFGYNTDVIGRSVQLLWGELTDRQAMTWLGGRIASRELTRASVVLYARDGTPRWVELVATPVEADASARRHLIAFRDVSSRKTFVDALTAERRKLQTTLAAIADGVVTVLPDGRIEFINEAAERLLGVTIQDAYGVQIRSVVRIVDPEGAPIDLLAHATEEPVRRGGAHLITPVGTVDVAYVASRIHLDGQGTVIVMRDVTAERRLAMRLSFEAAHDPLTGLQNRRAFLERLQEAVDGARERDEHHAVAFIDLDRFKIVNDRFGHATGDRLLREIGRVMGRVVRGNDVLARIGGDEFALLLTNCRLADGRRVAEKMRTAVDAYAIEHDGEVLGVGISVGLAPIEAETTSAEAALAEADAACYHAKAAGRNAISG